MPAARRQSRDPLERYYSRPEYVAPLVVWLRMVAGGDVASSRAAVIAARRALDVNSLTVEPCVGQGHLIIGARRFGLRSARAPWRTVDLDPLAKAAMWRGDWREDCRLWRPATDAVRAMSHRAAEDLRTATLNVTNPPFSGARDIVEASWRHCPNAVVVILQRDSWREPTEDRAQFLIDHPPDVITIGRCKFLGADGRAVLGKDGKPGSGDKASYSLFVWGPDRRGLANGMARIIRWKDAARALA
jgi:hypothetical protein